MRLTPCAREEALMVTAADYLEKEIDEAIAHADRRRRKHKWFSTIIWLITSGSAAAIPILLGLRVSPEVGNHLANAAMVLGGVASVLITYEAFYGHMALWAGNTAAAAQLRMLKSDLGYLRSKKIDGIDSGDLDAYQERFRQIQQGAAETWIHARQLTASKSAQQAEMREASRIENTRSDK
jgi:hypothetical protein